MSGLAKCFQLEVDPLEMIDLVSYVFFSKIYIFHKEQICAAALMFYSEYAVFISLFCLILFQYRRLNILRSWIQTGALVSCGL